MLKNRKEEERGLTITTSETQPPARLAAQAAARQAIAGSSRSAPSGVHVGGSRL